MRILGLDPGPVETAYCLIDEGYTVQVAGKTETALILKALTVSPPDQVVIESIQSYGMIVGRAVFDTCYTIGRILQTCDNMGIEWTLYPRPEYTRRICGVGKINDSILRRALEMRFGGYGEAKSDEVIPDGEPGAGVYKGGARKGQPRRREVRIPEPLFYLAGNSDKRSAFAVAVYHLDILKGGKGNGS